MAETISDGSRSALILYGSETGNAQDFADEIGRTCQRLHFQTQVDEMDAVDLNSLLGHTFVVFVISTTGQGDMPHNSLLFWRKLLRRKLPPGCLSSLKYTTFGLGDSTYVKFNWAARKLNKRLDQLGAATLVEGCESDEQFPEGIDGSFVQWAESLSKYLLESYPPSQAPIPSHVILPPRWSLSETIQNIPSQTNGHITSSPSASPPDTLLPVPNAWTATLVCNDRVTPNSHWQDVRHISFTIPPRQGGTKPVVNPGDCLTIYPKNFPEDVDKLIKLMDWTSFADSPLDLSLCQALPRNLFSPPNTTVRDIILNNIDFTAIPRRSFLKNMSYFATNPDHKDRLLEFTKPEYLDEYFDYATRSRRSILEVLQEFTSVKIPVDRILDTFPLVRGRDFSIANGGAQLDDDPSKKSLIKVDTLVALVKYRTILRKPRRGLCSRYLEALPLHSTINVTTKPVLTPIHGAANAQRPLVAIATGTGLAPIRSLIHERMTHPSPGPTLLFFGNRNRDADYFFREEWDSLVQDGNLEVFLAFSRDQTNKVYVQHLLREQADRLEDLIRQNSIFCVCGGSTKMADAAKKAVFEPYSSGKVDEEERKRHLEGLTWWQEIW